MSFIQADMGATVTVSLPGLAKLFEGIQTLQANQIDLGAKLEGLTAKVKELERQIEKTQHNILHESGESWVVAPTVAQASPPKENPQKQLNNQLQRDWSQQTDETLVPDYSDSEDVDQDKTLGLAPDTTLVARSSRSMETSHSPSKKRAQSSEHADGPAPKRTLANQAHSEASTAIESASESEDDVIAARAVKQSISNTSAPALSRSLLAPSLKPLNIFQPKTAADEDSPSPELRDPRTILNMFGVRTHEEQVNPSQRQSFPSAQYSTLKGKANALMPPPTTEPLFAKMHKPDSQPTPSDESEKRSFTAFPGFASRVTSASNKSIPSTFPEFTFQAHPGPNKAARSLTSNTKLVKKVANLAGSTNPFKAPFTKPSPLVPSHNQPLPNARPIIKARPAQPMQLFLKNRSEPAPVAPDTSGSNTESQTTKSTRPSRQINKPKRDGFTETPDFLDKEISEQFDLE